MTCLRFLPAVVAAAVACTPATRRAEVADRTATTSSTAIARLQQDARVLVRRATIEVEVENIAPAVERATKLTRDVEGYVENVTTNETKTAYLRLRVPSARLNEVLDSLARLGRVTGRSLSEDDVTVRSIDLEARVTSLRAARDKLRELLGRAATVADAVAAQGELARVQAELDGLEAQLSALRGAVAMSEVAVTLNRRVILGPLGVIASGLTKVIGKLFVWR